MTDDRVKIALDAAQSTRHAPLAPRDEDMIKAVVAAIAALDAHAHARVELETSRIDGEMAIDALTSIHKFLDDSGIPRGALPEDHVRNLVAAYSLRGDEAARLRVRVSELEMARAPGEFQRSVSAWMQACFGPEISSDVIERNHRFLEEGLELVQANGCMESEAHQLVAYVFGREKGEIRQEIGGVMVTLAALCAAVDEDMAVCGRDELARVWTRIEAIRVKQAAKPKFSPLPERFDPDHFASATVDGAYTPGPEPNAPFTREDKEAIRSCLTSLMRLGKDLLPPTYQIDLAAAYKAAFSDSGMTPEESAWPPSNCNARQACLQHGTCQSNFPAMCEAHNADATAPEAGEGGGRG